MIPPTSIDGTDITGATIDGTDVTEITVDGQTVFSAVGNIPDANELHHHFDATQSSTITTSSGNVVGWDDLTSNNRDLTGTTSGIETINGLDAVRFNFDVGLDTTFATIPQPLTIFAVMEVLTYDTIDNDNLISGVNNDDSFTGLFSDGGAFGGELQVFFGLRMGPGSKPSGPFVATILADGVNSQLRVNGVVDASGDAGTDGLKDGLVLGGKPGGLEDGGNLRIGEVATYPSAKSGNFSEIEQHLISKWSI